VLKIGTAYQTTYGTLWKDGTYFPRGTRVLLVGLHVEEGFCVQFPSDAAGAALEAWEDWTESDFLAPDGTIEQSGDISAEALAQARDVLRDAEEGCHLHLHDNEESD
jgi:hypothetical protein